MKVKQDGFADQLSSPSYDFEGAGDDPDDFSDDPDLDSLDLDGLDLDYPDLDDAERGSSLRPKALTHFPRDSGKVQNISIEEERRLVILAQGADRKARHAAITALFRAHERFLWREVLARKRRMVSDADPEDLFQEACKGFMHGIEKFEPERGNRLLTYAGWWVRQNVDRYIIRNRGPQTTAFHLDLVSKEIFKAYRAYMKERHRKKGDEPLSAAERQDVFNRIGKWPHEIDEMWARTYSGAYSLDAPAWGAENEENEETFLDLLTDSPFAAPDALARRFSDKRFIKALADEAGLKGRNLDIILARFGIGEEEEEPLTLEALGERFGLTRERVRQIETKALGKLCRAAQGMGWSEDPISSEKKKPSVEKGEDGSCLALRGPLAPVLVSDLPVGGMAHCSIKPDIAAIPERPEQEGAGDAEEERHAGKFKTLAQARQFESDLRPLPIEEVCGYACLTPEAVQKAHSMYQIVLEIERTGRPIVFSDRDAEIIRGIFVSPKIAARLFPAPNDKQASSIGLLRARYGLVLGKAGANGVVWFKEGAGEKKVILALLAPRQRALTLLKTLYAEDADRKQKQKRKTGGKAPSARGSDSVSTRGLSNAHDDPDLSLRTLFSAVSKAAENPQRLVRIEHPGGVILASAAPRMVDYFSSSEAGHRASEIEASRAAAPADKNSAALVSAFDGVAKGQACIVSVEGTKVVFFPENKRRDAAAFMERAQGQAFPALAPGAA